MSTMKIQLSSDEILHLLGDNDEQRLEIRNWILQEFCKRHLKGLVTPVLERAIKDEVLAHAASAANSIFKLNKTSWVERAVLTPTYQRAVAETVNDAVNKTITAQLTSEDVPRKVDEALQTLMASRINLQIEELVSKAIQSQLEKLELKVKVG